MRRWYILSPMEGFNESSARELVLRLVNSLGAKDEKGIVPFVAAWPRIAGTDFAAHSRVLDVRNGSVRIGVDHPGWLQRMHMEQRKIVASIQRKFPDLGVKTLHFTIVSSLEGEVTDFSPPKESGQRSSPEEIRPEETGATNQEGLGSAQDDHDFMSHLRGLEEALRKRGDSR